MFVLRLAKIILYCVMPFRQKTLGAYGFTKSVKHRNEEYEVHIPDEVVLKNYLWNETNKQRVFNVNHDLWGCDIQQNNPCVALLHTIQYLWVVFISPNLLNLFILELHFCRIRHAAARGRSLGKNAHSPSPSVSRRDPVDGWCISRALLRMRHLVLPSGRADRIFSIRFPAAAWKFSNVVPNICRTLLLVPVRDHVRHLRARRQPRRRYPCEHVKY